MGIKISPRLWGRPLLEHIQNPAQLHPRILVSQQSAADLPTWGSIKGENMPTWVAKDSFYTWERVTLPCCIVFSNKGLEKENSGIQPALWMRFRRTSTNSWSGNRLLSETGSSRLGRPSCHWNPCLRSRLSDWSLRGPFTTLNKSRAGSPVLLQILRYKIPKVLRWSAMSDGGSLKLSRIGLHNHLRKHAQHTGRRWDVIIGNDGPP